MDDFLSYRFRNQWRELVVKQANAIGTTFLRAALLPEAHGAPVEDLLRRYVALLLKYQPLSKDPVLLAEGLRLLEGIRAELWAQAVAASKASPTPSVATFITTLNETIDTEAERVAAMRNRVPGSVWLLHIVASLGCLTSSYSTGAQGARFPFSSILLPLLIAVVITLIADIASPYRGSITVSQQPLVDLQQPIRGPTSDLATHHGYARLYVRRPLVGMRFFSNFCSSLPSTKRWALSP